MSDTLLAHEPQVRLAGFVLVFGLMALLELASPRLGLSGRPRRWTTNLGMSVLSTLLLRLILPLGAVGVALWAQSHGYGLFNVLSLPLIVTLPLSLLALDLLIYGQHVAFHHFGIFWRIHKVHHADPSLDVTTALRFHPLEIILSMVIKIAVVAALGVPPVAVLVFEILLNACAMFNHSNLRLRPDVNRLLQVFIVTPDMHRVHHSVVAGERNSNFGFNLSIWDRIFATYHLADRTALDAMRIGLAEYLDLKPTRFFWSLILPFTKTRSESDRLAEKSAARHHGEFRP
tara:strand:- start:91680 stop:92543 length:864 start_codon:yes stop_codon:yes gene_type:complete